MENCRLHFLEMSVSFRSSLFVMEFPGLPFARFYPFVQPSPNLPLFPPPQARLHLYTNWKETKVHSHIGKFIAPKKMPQHRMPWIKLLRLAKTPLRYSKQNHDLTANCQQMFTIKSHQCGFCVPENLRRPQTTHSYQVPLRCISGEM